MDARAVGVTAMLLVRVYMLLHAPHTGLRCAEARQVSDGARAITVLAELVVATVADTFNLVRFVLPNSSGHVVPFTEFTVPTTLFNHFGRKLLKLLLGAATLVSRHRHGFELKVFLN